MLAEHGGQAVDIEGRVLPADSAADPTSIVTMLITPGSSRWTCHALDVAAGKRPAGRRPVHVMAQRDRRRA